MDDRPAADRDDRDARDAAAGRDAGGAQPRTGPVRLFLTVLLRLLPGRRTPPSAPAGGEERTRPGSRRADAVGDTLNAAGHLSTAAGPGGGGGTTGGGSGGGAAGGPSPSGGGSGGALPQGGGGGGGSWLDGFSL
ncbi:hypothetical protein [Streptomyces spiramenti]|uniref:Uncharacterized protein n=1 Tax=Streptomyces spiramenti TaxID=2720606 RepID=A0ABX1AR29_9ACTN|nr:hypothetical protein [Streptomyces spiramenti]NJP66725.1 hypothetical protein [Streptomyces spiramenti]